MPTVTAPHTTDSAHIRELEDAQASVRAQMEHIQKQLEDLQRLNHPDLVRYINCKTATKIEDLRAPQPPMRDALLEDIKTLQEQAKALQAELEAARRKQHLPPAKPHAAQAHHAAHHAGHAQVTAGKEPGASIAAETTATAPPDPELERRRNLADGVLTNKIQELNDYPDMMNIEQVLKAMKEVSGAGGDDKRGWAAVRTAGEKLMKQGIHDLNSSPSFDNMHDVIEAMKVVAMSGGDETSGWTALRTATGKNVHFAISILHTEGKDMNITMVRKQRNIAMVLMIGKEAALLGNEAASAESMLAVTEAVVALRKDFENQFRTAPTPANFDTFIAAVRQQGLLTDSDTTTTRLENPPGMPSIAPGKTHRIKPGETLQDISKHYFGSPKWWDAIVFRNIEKFIGLPDPNKIAPGTELKIS